MLIEDDQELSDALTRSLMRWGYQVTPLRHVRHGLQAAALYQFDVAVVDQALPGLDVQELVRQFKGQVRDIEVVLMSSYADDESEAQAIQAGIFAYFPNLCRLATLQAAIERAILKHRSAGQNPRLTCH